MDKIVIKGGNKLNGEIIIAGSKNSSLPIIAATIMCQEEVCLLDIPHIQDSVSMLHLISCLGGNITIDGPVDNGFGFPLRQVKVNCVKVDKSIASYDIVRKMRASVLILGPLLARFGKAEISLPGGCTIGARPVNLHIEGLEKLGAKIEIDSGFIKASVEGKLRGAVIDFSTVSVGATENILMAAVLAEGQTIINNAAKEPEIIALGEFLQAMGAQIKGLGTSQIIVDGIEKLSSATYKIPADRIQAGTYAIAAAITDGRIIMHNTNLDLFNEFKAVFQQSGVKLSQEKPNQVIAERHPDGLKPCKMQTDVYPGFPTDLQAQIMTLLLYADGISEISENIFENRFMHVPELIRMGAKIDILHNKAIIYGGKKLKGASVMASDLRASVSLIIAGLVAEETTEVHRIYHLDRGYDFLSGKLAECGANLIRIKN